MSLINDVLRDLQRRQTPLAQPLAGLQPVPVAGPGGRRALWVGGAVFAVLATAMVWFGLRPAQSVMLQRIELPAVHRDSGTQEPRQRLPAPPESTTLGAPPAPPVLVVSHAARDAAADSHIADSGTGERPQPVPARAPASVGADAVVVFDRAADDAIEQPAGNSGYATSNAPPPRALVDAPVERTTGAAAVKGSPPHDRARAQLEIKPADPAAVMAMQRREVQQLARQLAARGAMRDAIELLERYRPAVSVDAEYLALLAALLQRSGRHPEAERIYSELVTLDRPSAAWWMGLAISREALAHRAEALNAYRQALGGTGLDPALTAYAQRRIAALKEGDERS